MKPELAWHALLDLKNQNYNKSGRSHTEISDKGLRVRLGQLAEKLKRANTKKTSLTCSIGACQWLKNNLSCPMISWTRNPWNTDPTYTRLALHNPSHTTSWKKPAIPIQQPQTSSLRQAKTITHRQNLTQAKENEIWTFVKKCKNIVS